MVLRSIISKWDLDLDFRFKLDPSVTLLSTDIKFKYQLKEEEIDVVEELELYFNDVKVKEVKEQG